MKGSIPARAGEPSPQAAAWLWHMVYPRACGGTGRGFFAMASRTGLSPRVRGNRKLRGSDGRPSGSIPARAGEPRSTSSRSPIVRVYPRACGGTRGGRRLHWLVTGLSPRVRGNQAQTPGRLYAMGSIPARAGEPALSIPRHRSCRVYPRACGGTVFSPCRRWRYSGLSPRVRGNHLPGFPAPSAPGSIPARAGEPNMLVRVLPPTGVYPRACGGTSRLSGFNLKVEGLSPRVRGNPSPRRPRRGSRGSIPARAGEPRS